MYSKHMRTFKTDRAGLDATRIPSDIEIAWAAGVYEGEGSCVRTGPKSNSFSVTISQKDPELLYRLREMFGGSVFFRYQGKQRFTVYTWVLCGTRARIFLAAIFPWLTARRKIQIEATSAKEFLEFVGPIPSQGIMQFLSEKLEGYVADHLAARKARRVAYQKRFYEQRKADPEFMSTRRNLTRAWRERKKSEASNVVEIA